MICKRSAREKSVEAILFVGWQKSSTLPSTNLNWRHNSAAMDLTVSLTGSRTHWVSVRLQMSFGTVKIHSTSEYSIAFVSWRPRYAKSRTLDILLGLLRAFVGIGQSRRIVANLSMTL